jgi:hypothetical protein
MNPRLAVGRCIRAFRHVHTQLRKVEYVATADGVSTDDRESEGADRGHDRDVLSSDREIHNKRVGLDAELDLDVR